MDNLCAINNLLPYGICQITIEKSPVILYANQKFYELAGYTKTEYEQRWNNQLFGVLERQDRILLEECFEKIEQEEKRIQIRIVDKNRKLKTVQCICRGLNNCESEKSIILTLQEMYQSAVEGEPQAAEIIFDTVTNVLNREACESRIDASIARSETIENRGFCLISILHFQNVNERYGTVIGDAILRRIADTVQSVFTSAEVVGRTAGTEFCVWLMQNSRQEVAAMAELFLEKVKSIYVGENDSLSLEAKISITFAEDEEQYRQLYKRAHSVLYHMPEYVLYQFDDEIERDIEKLQTNVMLVDTKNEIEAEKNSEQQSLFKKEFISRMSHEIRTPMNAICGMSEMLLQNGLNGLNLEYANVIKAESDNLLAIVDDILDISRLESGEIELEEESYQLQTILEDLSCYANQQLQKRDITFLLQVNPFLPKVLYGDVKKIHQVLQKLLSNGLKFTESGFVSLMVDFEEIDESDMVLLRFAVKDSGIGIQKEDVSKLFAEFVQVDTRINRDIEGVGLGLSICKKLAEYMNGSIVVESEYGTGSKFTFVVKQKVLKTESVFVKNSANDLSLLVFEKNRYELESLKALLSEMNIQTDFISSKSEFLAMAESKAYSHVLFDYSKAFYDIKDKVAEHPEITYVGLIGKGTLKPTLLEEENSCFLYKPISVYSINKMLYGDSNTNSLQKFIAPDLKVLIVDDNPVNLKVAQGLISSYQCQIRTVSSGLEAVELLAEQSEYDLLFIDYMMPQMDGIETLRMIRENLGVYGKNVKAVALTANVLAEAQKEYRESGFQGFLAKPIDVKRMHELMELLVPEVLRQPIDISVHAEQPGVGLSEADLARVAMKGVDTEAGVRCCGNKIEEYLNILKIVLLSGKTKVEELERYAKNKNYEAYGIEAHAFKSVAASIGAFKQSDLAREHEFAVKEGKYEIIEKGYPKLINSYKYLLSQVQGVLDKEENRTHNEVMKKTVEESVWKNLIQESIQAICSFKQKQAKQLLEELKGYILPAQIEAVIEQAAEKMKLYDDEAAETLLRSINLEK